jgi:hypothetical protein
MFPEWFVPLLVISHRGELTRQAATRIQHDECNVEKDWLQPTARSFATFLDLPADTAFKLGCDLIHTTLAPPLTLPPSARHGN